MTKGNIKDRYRAITTWEGGQRLFNFAYSVGAAIVIWGALFKILHLPGGNTLLCIGMGTEVLMFLITAFDRPPKEYKWENVFPELNKNAHDTADSRQGTAIGGAGLEDGAIGPSEAEHAGSPAAQPQCFGTDAGSIPTEAAAAATHDYVEQLSAISQQLALLRETTQNLNEVSSLLLNSYRAISDNASTLTANSQDYVSQMSDLNRNLGGLNTIYEIQLKSVSSQLESIDRVNRGIKDIRDMYEKSASQSARYCEETEKMARYMQQLNQVYEKMLHAMTVNMYRPMMNDIPGAQSSGTVK